MMGKWNPASIVIILCCVFWRQCKGDSNVGQDLTWVGKEGCSRLSSRQVRGFLDNEVYPRLPYPPEGLPSACPLNPLYDQFLDQERNKTELNRADYKCNLCGKHFRTEFYLDKHMAGHHKEALRGAADDEHRICLGDLCPLFGCSADPNSAMHQSYKAGRQNLSAREKRGLSEQNFGTSDEGCTSASLERQTYKCEALMRKCFGALDGSLQAQLSKNICGSLQCVGGMLKGSIAQRGLSAEYLAGKPLGESSNWISGDDDVNDRGSGEASSKIWSTVRMALGGSILAFVWAYAYFSNVSIPYVWERAHKAGEGNRSHAQRVASGNRWKRVSKQAVGPSWFGGKKAV